MTVERSHLVALFGSARGAVFLVGFLLANPQQARAQALQGRVVEAGSGAPVAGTTIEARPDRANPSRRATSDSAGRFSFTLPAAGLYTVVATKIGYARHQGDTVRVGDSETVGLEVRLDRNAVPLKPVIVTERISWLPEGFEARRAAGFGRFLTHKDIESRRASRTSDLLRGMPGLVLIPVRRGRGPGSNIAMRGPAGLCQPAIYIDGSYIAPFTEMSMDDVISPLVIDAVEVYNSTSTAPIQFRTGNCGVVLFWTKRGPGEDRARTKWWKLAIGATVGVALVFLVK